MVYNVLLHRNVIKRLKDAPEHIKRKFEELVEELKYNPIPSEKLRSSRGGRTHSGFVWASTG